MLAQLQQVLKLVAVSENERDSAGEPANLVDGLFAVARAIERCAVTLTTELGVLHDRLGRIEAARPSDTREAGRRGGPPAGIPPRSRS